MANDAVPVPKPDVIHQDGLRWALDPSPISEKSDHAGFLAQVSGNPFFTAVNIPGLQVRVQNADMFSRVWASLDLAPFLLLARKVFAMPQVLLKDA